MKNRLGLLIIVLLSVSCAKEYEEGGKVKNAQEIIAKEWSMEKAYKNGSFKEVINANPQIGEVEEDWKFKDDATCSTEDGNNALKGTWMLSKDGFLLTVTITSPVDKSSVQEYHILKMTAGSDGEMIWEQTIDGDSYRYELRSSS